MKMLRKAISVTVIIVAFLLIFGLPGCKKKSEQPTAVKTEAQYQAQAQKEITEDNMDAELQKIEKDLDADINAEQ
jgi:curli biogenesis system outer membrane secretion channel CsgG